MHSVASMMALAATMGTAGWCPEINAPKRSYGGNPWAARRGKKRWKHLRRNRG